jgi:hypothetical protein
MPGRLVPVRRHAGCRLGPPRETAPETLCCYRRSPDECAASLPPRRSRDPGRRHEVADVRCDRPATSRPRCGPRIGPIVSRWAGTQLAPGASVRRAPQRQTWMPTYRRDRAQLSSPRRTRGCHHDRLSRGCRTPPLKALVRPGDSAEGVRHGSGLRVGTGSKALGRPDVAAGPRPLASRVRYLG